MKREKRNYKRKRKNKRIQALKSKLKFYRSFMYPRTPIEKRAFEEAALATRMLELRNGKWLCPRCGEITMGSFCRGGIPLPTCSRCAEEESQGHFDCDQCRWDWHRGLTGQEQQIEYIRVH